MSENTTRNPLHQPGTSPRDWPDVRDLLHECANALSVYGDGAPVATKLIQRCLALAAKSAAGTPPATGDTELERAARQALEALEHAAGTAGRGVRYPGSGDCYDVTHPPDTEQGRAIAALRAALARGATPPPSGDATATLHRNVAGILSAASDYLCHDRSEEQDEIWRKELARLSNVLGNWSGQQRETPARQSEGRDAGGER